MTEEQSLSAVGNRLASLPEILDRILQRTDWPTLTACARVSRFWSKLALGQIWENLNSLFPLLETAGPLLEIDGDLHLWDFQGPLTSQQIVRLKFYAAKVRSLVHNELEYVPEPPVHSRRLSEEAFAVLQSTGLVGSAFLPNLRSINWTVCLDFVGFSHLLSLLGPSVVDLEVVCDMDEDDEGPIIQFFESLGVALPPTCGLKRFGWQDNLLKTRQEAPATMITFLKAHLDLHHVKLGHILGLGDAELLSALDAMQNLDSLSLEIFDGSDSEAAFRIFLCSLVKTLPQLTTMCLRTSRSTPWSFAAAIQPLLSITSLKKLELGHLMGIEGINEKAIELMDNAWPNIEVLRLGSEPACSPARTVGLVPLHMLSEFAKRFPKLRELGLSVDAHPDRSGVSHSSKIGSVFKSLKRLDLGKNSIACRDDLPVAEYLSCICHANRTLCFGRSRDNPNETEGRCYWREVSDMMWAIWFERTRLQGLWAQAYERMRPVVVRGLLASGWEQHNFSDPRDLEILHSMKDEWPELKNTKTNNRLGTAP